MSCSLLIPDHQLFTNFDIWTNYGAPMAYLSGVLSDESLGPSWQQWRRENEATAAAIKTNGEHTLLLTHTHL